MIIKSLDDIQQLQVPEDVASHPAFQEELKCLRILRREAGGRYPICCYVTATMTLPALLMGMERWMDLLFCGPDDLREELLKKCHAFFVKEVQAYRDAGADLLLYSNPFGSTEFVPMRYLLEHAMPWIEKDMAAAGTAGMVYYCGSARFNKVIDAVFQRTGIGAYYLSPLDDVAEGKQIIAGRALCCGTINDIRMIDWRPDKVRQEVRRIVLAGKPGGRFRVRAAFDAAGHSGGEYPGHAGGGLSVWQPGRCGGCPWLMIARCCSVAVSCTKRSGC